MRSGWRLRRSSRLSRSSLLGAVETSAAKTVWLCKPGLEANPCTPDQSLTSFSPSLQQAEHREPWRAPAAAEVRLLLRLSDGQRPAEVQANRRIDPELRSIVLYQAARFSRHCRVYAPVYRQFTIVGLRSPDATPEMRARAYGDVRNAWRTYLRRFNRGRGVVLISHSQGTFCCATS